MPYLNPSEYAAYGLPPDTPDGFLNMASALIEAHCRRPTLMAATCVERLRLTAGRQTARLSHGPLQAGCLTAVRVRYAQGRRGDLSDYDRAPFGLEVAIAFGLPGAWSTLDPTTVDVDPGARELTFPGNFMGLGYNEAEVTYTAGFVTVPEHIQAACAQIMRNAQATPALNVSSTKLDTMQMHYFSGSLIDDGVRQMLRPYVAEKLG